MVVEKRSCEICGELNKKILHLHHIVERTSVNCNNSDFNLACLCPSCHAKIHANLVKIIGVWPSTNINGRLLVYINEFGECNVPGMELEKPPHEPRNESIKIYNKD